MAIVLRADKISATAARLRDRIGERFPGSGLWEIARGVHAISEQARERVDVLGKRNWPLRFLGAVLVAAIAGLLVYFVSSLRTSRPETLTAFVELLEPALGAMVFIGAFFLFVWTLEVRWKRGRALRALHELRSLAHVIDMHQLTKDPERIVFPGADTESSPRRDLTPFLLSRYLDYCCELLALISKIAALYAQSFEDEVALDGVDQVESLTTGLARKIWQKIMILERVVESPE